MSSTRTKILETTRRQLEEVGLPRLTIQGVATELGVTKQAVLYWFPSKNALLSELFLEAIEAESEALVAAIDETSSAAAAIEGFLRRGFAYHRANLPSFRLTYLLPQMERTVVDLIDPELAAARLYPATSRFYSALEEKLRADPAFPSDVNPRNFAVSLHMSLLGHVLLRGSMDAIGDEFRQSFEEMIDASLGVLTGFRR